jgi:superfamily II DNA or RNA helicase
MIRRPYQEVLVEKAVSALSIHNNTLAVAPTGSGKTLMLSWLLEELGGRQMILAHREELVNQNREKFHLINPKRTSSIYGLGTKDLSGETIFGMAQTLGRNREVEKLPKLDVLVVDECHHSRAETYLRIVQGIRDKNPDCKIAGFTATAARGDKRGLRPTFDNVCDIVYIQDLINLGFLVPPKTYIASLPGLAGEIEKIRKTSSGEYDMEEVDLLMNTQPINESIFREWYNLAGDRKAIVFCSTINHAQAVHSLFVQKGIKAECIFGDTPNRSNILQGYDHGDTQVLFNVAVLTEGYDSPITSCIVLLRPCSFKSTVLQCIGRGLRINPDAIKKDCLVLDFGETLKRMTSFDLVPRLEDEEKGEAPTKTCPQCGTIVPKGTALCPLCEHEWKRTGEGKEKEAADVVLTEIKIMEFSPFKWIDLFGSGKVMVACGFSAWVVCATAGGDWVSMGKLKGKGFQRLSIGDKIPCLAQADDFMRKNEDSDAAKKTKRWLNDQATFRQLELLEGVGWDAKGDMGLKKYQATCLLNFLWSKNKITEEVMKYAANY